MVLCSTPPAPLAVDVAACRLLMHKVASSTATREYMRVLAVTTYGRCVLGLAGFLTVATEHIAAFVKCMCDDVREDDIKVVREILLLLALTVVDEDHATYIARIGAHPLLMRLMEHGNEDIEEAAAKVVTACTSSPSAVTFPHRVREIEEVELLWPLAALLPLDPRDDVPKSADESTSTLQVLIRQVPTRMTGQNKTGYRLWGAAFILARWIHKHRDMFVNKSVLEVGSGLGLGGITAARYANHTTLTDYQSDTCSALSYNVRLNKSFTHELDASKPEVKVSLLDWDSTDSIEALPKADVVIASDIICEPSTAEGFLHVVRHHIQKNSDSVAYLMNANSHSRFGITHLHALLAASIDLSFTVTPVHELSDGADLLQTVSDAQELSYEFYEIRATS
ncbi:Predicted methyltransferase [Plasmopara halstedii]|uniref:Predicted methyltransferase n=1 Tax=Plasmopara halstedii TaxID=4781 RepID=A0A0P1A746_PLAHL|nr:Predicted methyltransferase [Plasmopara halstedii]CEG36449.1 Predicted methyltransferase [Plasmopara halstedii]|eukprot:XP_024572818.1 Predicted methyltransferase [Plasmopara halstedii]